MNGINMQQFMLGFVVASPLESRQRLLMGLTASMMPADNPLGIIMLKPQVDALVAKEAEIASLKSQVDAATSMDSFFNHAWFAKKTLKAGDGPDVSPKFPGSGQLDVSVDDNDKGVTARWDPTNRTVVIEAQQLTARKAVDVHVIVKSGNRVAIAVRTITV
jgi:hypothetical protein